jgi:hypothetical protein
LIEVFTPFINEGNGETGVPAAGGGNTGLFLCMTLPFSGAAGGAATLGEADSRGRLSPLVYSPSSPISTFEAADLRL